MAESRVFTVRARYRPITATVVAVVVVVAIAGIRLRSESSAPPISTGHVARTDQRPPGAGFEPPSTSTQVDDGTTGDLQWALSASTNRYEEDCWHFNFPETPYRQGGGSCEGSVFDRSLASVAKSELVVEKADQPPGTFRFPPPAEKGLRRVDVIYGIVHPMVGAIEVMSEVDTRKSVPVGPVSEYRGSQFRSLIVVLEPGDKTLRLRSTSGAILEEIATQDVE